MGLPNGSEIRSLWIMYVISLKIVYEPFCICISFVPNRQEFVDTQRCEVCVCVLQQKGKCLDKSQVDKLMLQLKRWFCGKNLTKKTHRVEMTYRSCRHYSFILCFSFNLRWSGNKIRSRNWPSASYFITPEIVGINQISYFINNHTLI